jgi:uncharacterized protein (TIGR03086 family)
MPVDLEPAAKRMIDLVGSVTDDDLARPTPCEGMNLGALLDHIASFCVGFTNAANKSGGGNRPPAASADNLDDDWRTRIPAGIETLVEAWREPVAWTGMTKAGGLDLPGEIAGVIALDELVLHGWDLAKALGVSYDVEPAQLEAVKGFVEQFAGADQPREGLFGPPVDVPADSSLFDRVLGMAGRDPAWAPS